MIDEKDSEKDTRIILENCLYFTANSLSRLITKMAEEEFIKTGFTPSQAFLIMLVNEEPGCNPKLLSEMLNLAPSTTTRLVEPLLTRGIIRKEQEGKMVRIFPTEKAGEVFEEILMAWKSLHMRYSKLLGEENGEKLTLDIHKAALRLMDE